jgi:2-polyprenyl-3-methyl-5-hydroxy-6-metoxy-1,4-benzoquinol methylase
MSDSQRQTIARYHSFLQTQAISAALHAARASGVLDVLRDGQQDLTELARQSGSDPEAVAALLRVLVAVGVVEQYGEDFALSQAARLMVGPDSDLGEEVYRDLGVYLRAAEETGSVEEYRRRLCARQWTHTAAAVQAAEVLEIGNLGPLPTGAAAAVDGQASWGRNGLRVLELGGGAGVWSAAMAYRDPTLRVTVVDNGLFLHQCRQTYHSIDVQSRLETVEADYRTWDVPLGEFDLVIIPEVLQLESDAEAVILLGRAADALREGGEVAIFETLNEHDGPAIALATHALELSVATPRGQQRSAAEIQQLLRGAGFEDAQWGWLTASSQGLGLVLARKS